MIKKTLMSFILLIGLFITSIVVSPNVFGAITDEMHDVEIVVVTGDDEQVNADLTAQAYNQKISVDLSSFSEEFVYFIVNGEIIEDENYLFTVTSSLNIVAVLKDSNEYVGVFLDSNGAFISADYVLSGETPIAPSVEGYSKPGYSVDSLNAWSPSVTALTSDVVYELQYTLDATTLTYDIAVTNGSSSSVIASFNEVVTVTADAGAVSGYWMEDEAVVAYGLTYSFTALSNRDLTFIESEDTPVPLVNLKDVSGIRENYVSYLGQVDLPDGYELIEYGFLFDSTEKVLTVDQAEVVRASGALADTLEFLTSVSINTYQSIRAYAIIDNGSTLETIYSEQNVFTSSAGASDLFISEVSEDGNEKALELYNGTGSDIDLSDYKIKLYSNGNTSSSEIALSGTLSNDTTYTIVYNQSSDDLKAYADFIANVSFNGNDVIALYKVSTDENIDVLGTIGNDSNFNNDVDLVRNENIVAPNEVYTTDEWHEVTLGDYTSFGNHSMVSGSSSSNQMLISDIITDVQSDFNAPTETVLLEDDYVLPTTDLLGTTVSWSVTAGAEYISENGVVTRPAYGQGDQSATLEYTLNIGENTIIDEISFTIVEALETFTVSFDANGGTPTPANQVVDDGSLVDEPTTPPTKDGYVFIGWFDAASGGNEWDFANGLVSDNMTLYAQWQELGNETIYIETFDNSTATSSYSDGSFVGVNGVTWTFVASRNGNGDSNDSNIELPAIMLRRSSDNSNITSSTISGGISSFTVSLYKGFTGGGDRQVEVFINGISVGTSEAFDDFEEHIFTIENIDVTGDFTIEIRNITGKQIIIDNITWVTN